MLLRLWKFNFFFFQWISVLIVSMIIIVVISKGNPVDAILGYTCMLLNVYIKVLCVLLCIVTCAFGPGNCVCMYVCTCMYICMYVCMYMYVCYYDCGVHYLVYCYGNM